MPRAKKPLGSDIPPNPAVPKGTGKRTSNPEVEARAREAFRLHCEGKSNVQIAAYLHVSEKQVREYIHRVGEEIIEQRDSEKDLARALYRWQLMRGELWQTADSTRLTIAQMKQVDELQAQIDEINFTIEEDEKEVKAANAGRSYTRREYRPKHAYGNTVFLREGGNTHTNALKTLVALEELEAKTLGLVQQKSVNEQANDINRRAQVEELVAIWSQPVAYDDDFEYAKAPPVDPSFLSYKKRSQVADHPDDLPIEVLE